MGMFDDIPSGGGGGGGGMFDDIEAPQTKGVIGNAKDFGLSAVTGAVHGAAGFLPEMRHGLQTLENKYREGLDLPTKAVAPGAAETNAAIDQKYGLHAPQGTAGKFGESAGEVVGNPATYFGPGGWLAKTLQGAASGLGAEAAGEFTGDNPLARLAGSVIAGPLAGRALNPQMGSAAAQRMAQRGMTEMTPGQLFGLTGAEEKAESIPVLGNMVKKAQGRSFEDFNRTTGNQVLSPIGEKVDKGMTAGHDLVDHVHEKLDSRYDQLVPSLHFVPDRQWANDLATIDRDASFSLPQTTLDHFRSIVDNRLSPNRWVQQINPNGSSFSGLQGPQFKQIESELTHLASQYGSSSDAAQRIMGQHLSSVVTAMRSNLERSNPAQAAELKNLNTAWAMYTRMRTAAANRVTTGGVFSPGDLLSAIKRGDKSVGKGMFARGDALMQKYATDAQSVLGKKIPNSASADRAAFMAAPGLATWLGKKFIEHPIAGVGATAATAAGMGAYSGPGQRALNAIARPASGFRGNYAAAGRGAGLVRPLLTTPYGSSDEGPYAAGGGVPGKDDGGGLSDADQAAMMPETFNPFADWTRQAAGKDVGTIRNIGAGLGDLATLPQRAIEASAQDVQRLGEQGYEPQSVGPAAETAMTMIGGPAEEGVLRTGLGIRARGAPMGKLEQLKRLEDKGVSPSMSYAMTGWYRGADSKPRFWLPDTGAKLKSDVLPAYEGAHASIPWDDMRLGDVWDHPRLYDAYPWLKDIPVKQERNPEWGGHFSPDENAIYVANGRPEFFEDSLHHEVVHAIQQHEGFSPGTNAAAMAPKELPGYEAKIGAVEQYVAKKAADIGVNHDLAWVVSNMGKDDLDEYTKPIFDKLQSEGLVDKYRDLTKAKTAAQTARDEAYKRYLHVHGESEARDAPFIRRNPNSVPRGGLPLHVNPELTPGRDIEVLRAFGGRISSPYSWA